MNRQLSMRIESSSTAPPKRSISQTLLHIVFATALTGIVFGCETNTTPIPDAPVESSNESPNGSSNGSFASSNTADCLPAIDLVDQHGARVSLEVLKGKPVLIDFIYANCATACPVLTSRFAQIAGKLGGSLGTRVTMVSVTIDPEHDHPAQLLDYARTHDADRKGWLLLTGTPADIEAVLRVYQLKRERETDGTIAHVTTSFLLGPDGKQIRMYDTMEVAPDTVVGDIDRTFSQLRPRALPQG
jgi:protein SCO1